MIEPDKKSSGAFVRSQISPLETVGPGIRRQMLGYGEELMVCRVELDTGAAGSVHAHRHSQSTYIVSGRFRVRIGDSEQELGPGDGYYAEPHVEHGVVCLSAGVLIDSFSPARVDFLNEEHR